MRGVIDFDWRKIIGIILGAIIVMGIVTYYGFTGESTYLNYTYSTAINDTVANLDSSTNATYIETFELGRSIQDESAKSYITSTVNNTNTTTNATVTVYLNDNSLGTMTALNGTTTTHKFTGVQDYIVSGKNTVLYVSDLATPTQKVLKTEYTYNSDVKDVGAKPTQNILINVALVISILVFVVEYIVRKLGF